MSHISRMTMIGLYNYDSTLFDKMILPDGISRDDFINSFLLKYGECPVIYPNWDFMQFALGVWANKWHDSIARIVRAFSEDYNPLHNFDRHETYTDTEDTDRKNNSVTDRINNSTTTGNSSTDSSNIENRSNDADTNRSGMSEDTVSAYNEDSYQPDKKNDSTESVNVSETGRTTNTGNAKTNESSTLSGTGKDTVNGTENTDRKLVHEGHLYGNIGVTESTTMLMHEKELRENNNIIDIVCDMLYKEVCIYIY